MIDAKTRMEEIRSLPSTYLLWEYDRLVQKLELLSDLEDWDLDAMSNELAFMRAEIVYRMERAQEVGAV